MNARSGPARPRDVSPAAREAPDWITVKRVDKVPPGKMVAATACNVRLLIANVNGEIRVTGPVCPHAGGPLALGELHEGRVTCPWHGSVFDLDTGAVVEPPATERLPVYRARIVGDEIQVLLPRQS